MCAIAQHFARPGTPTDQAWIESLFSHIKADWPHLDSIRDPAVLRAELATSATSTTPAPARRHRLRHPRREHEGRAPAIRPPAAPACTSPFSRGSPTTAPTDRTPHYRRA